MEAGIARALPRRGVNRPLTTLLAVGDGPLDRALRVGARAAAPPQRGLTAAELAGEGRRLRRSG